MRTEIVCGECNGPLTIKKVEDGSHSDIFWMEPCEKCVYSAALHHHANVMGGVVPHDTPPIKSLDPRYGVVNFDQKREAAKNRALAEETEIDTANRRLREVAQACEERGRPHLGAERANKMEAALKEIRDICAVSEGQAAAFYGYLARKGLGEAS
jgi:hypothetical protein